MGKRRESFEAVQKSTVRIKDTQGRTWGTGFFISREGHLLTCAHVVQDAGGWKNVRVLDQPVTCLYEGNPDRDDFSLLQVEDVVVIPAELETDFDPGDEFISFGFSNDDFYGAPIRGEITAFARCGKLGDQKLIRLETFSDAQRIEGGQSGAPVCIYKRNKYKVIGLIVASEDLNGGLALPISTVLKIGALQKKLKKYQSSNLQTLSLILFFFILTPSLGLLYKDILSQFTRECAKEKIGFMEATINSDLDKGEPDSALIKIEQYMNECSDNDSLIIAKTRILIEKKEYQEVIRLIQSLLNRKPGTVEFVRAKYNLGIALSENGDCQKALEEFKKIETDIKLKHKVYYNMGLCHYKLKEWAEAIPKLEYVVANKKYATNSKQENTGFSFYYRNSLSYLIDINAKLWHQNQDTPQALDFSEAFIKYYKLFFENINDISKQKESLDRINADVKNNSEKSPVYSYIYKTQEFRNMLCQLYQDIKSDVPSNIKNYCSTVS